MIENSYKAVIEDSSRNRFMFYYAGSSVCCKEISKDGLTRDTIIASQVKDNFLAAIDLQDHVYVVCLNNDKGLLLFSYEKNAWKLEQILNIQSDGNVHLLSFFAYNGSTHIIYAKQMAIANFYNVYHLHKPGSPSSYHLTTSWRKNNVCEIYAENLNTAYSGVITKDGAIHLVTEWYDGNNFLINYYWLDYNGDSWKKKTITTLFKKDIVVNMLYDDNVLNLLCYTYEDEISAIFCYSKKESSIKDFEFNCLYKIKTEAPIYPNFHIDSGSIYLSWIQSNSFSQYALNKEQKSWSKKIESIIPSHDVLQDIEYIRNRKGKSLLTKKTYFSIDHKNNINLPYFKDSTNDYTSGAESKNYKNIDGDLVRYIPYILEELKSLTETVKELKDLLSKSENKVSLEEEPKKTHETPRLSQEQIHRLSDNNKLKKSSFKDQFMNTNKLLTRPEATALFVGTASLPNPDAIAKKGEIPIVENTPDDIDSTTSIQTLPQPEKAQLSSAAVPAEKDIQLKPEADATNLFKKIGDFFK